MVSKDRQAISYFIEVMCKLGLASQDDVEKAFNAWMWNHVET